MRKSGFTEVINFSFMGVSDLDLIGISGSDDRRKTISINNPLSQDECLLRTTLAPALIGNLKYNLDRGMEDIRIFEKAKVFADRGAGLPLEELRLGGVLYREKSPSLCKEETGGVFLAKGAIESLFAEVRIEDYVFLPSSEPFLQPGQAADVYVMDSRLGYLGVLTPDTVEKLDLKKQRPEVVLFELNLDLFLRYVPDSIRYSPTPRYPSVERDIAIVLDETIPSSHIQDVIRTFPTDLIEQASVFDYFKGGAIPRGKKSLAFNIVYRSKDRTLTDDEIEKLHASLVSYVIEKTGGELRS
jgi:phenylalanyl-tRNA synthetase beta chain